MKITVIAIGFVVILGGVFFTIAASPKKDSDKNVVVTSNNGQGKKDKTEYAFVDDSKVKGAWEAVDFVPQIKDFKTDKKYTVDGLYLKKLAFAKDGKMLWTAEKGDLSPTSMTWTKGLVINKNESTASKYTIKEINGSEYMFFEWKSGDYTIRGMEPQYYVLKKIDDKDYTDYKPVAMKQDKVDYPFVNDPKMIGEWNSVSFVEKIDEFAPGKPSNFSLFLQNINIEKGGTANLKVGSEEPFKLEWTKGMILDKQYKLASKCEIKEIDGDMYMFYEWKSGDYVYRGMQPYYYVLKKAK